MQKHRYGVCNAMETLLVDEKVAEEFLPRVAELYTEKRELRGCAETQRILGKQSKRRQKKIGTRNILSNLGSESGVWYGRSD
jgi:gamma-glutamyl phosphate reductase